MGNWQITGESTASDRCRPKPLARYGLVNLARRLRNRRLQVRALLGVLFLDGRHCATTGDSRRFGCNDALSLDDVAAWGAAIGFRNRRAHGPRRQLAASRRNERPGGENRIAPWRAPAHQFLTGLLRFQGGPLTTDVHRGQSSGATSLLRACGPVRQRWPRIVGRVRHACHRDRGSSIS